MTKNYEFFKMVKNPLYNPKYGGRMFEVPKPISLVSFIRARYETKTTDKFLIVTKNGAFAIRFKPEFVLVKNILK